jgi:23S rRNA pseudouridine955/2504/2580 synthase
MGEKTVRTVPAQSFPVIYEDDSLVVIDKPAGTAVHGGSGVSFGVIESMRAARQEPEFLELVHRLDRDTSGLLMLAKRRQMLVKLHALLREGGVNKRYLALIQGRIANDRQHIRASLTKWTTVSGERRVKVDPDGQIAHTIVTCVERFADYSLVEAELRTGRTHQIRVHLASIGHPIVGDEKYGSDAIRDIFRAQGLNRMYLHAHTLALPHPGNGQTISLLARLPDQFEQALKWVRSP